MEPRVPNPTPPAPEPVQTNSQEPPWGKVWSAVRDIAAVLGSAAGIATYADSKTQSTDAESAIVPDASAAIKAQGPVEFTVKRAPAYREGRSRPRGTNDLEWVQLEPGEALGVDVSERAVVFCPSMVSMVGVPKPHTRRPVCMTDIGSDPGAAIASVAYAEYEVYVSPRTPCQCVKMPQDDIPLITLVIRRELDRLNAAGLLPIKGRSGAAEIRFIFASNTRNICEHRHRQFRVKMGKSAAERSVTIGLGL